MTKHHIGSVSAFPEMRGKKVDVDGIEIAVFKIGGELYGIQNRCPHKNAPLHIIGEGRYFSKQLIKEGYYDPNDEERKAPDQDIRGAIDEDELTVYCPWHYLRWNLVTGENEETNICLPTYDITVDEDSDVWVEI